MSCKLLPIIPTNFISPSQSSPSTTLLFLFQCSSSSFSSNSQFKFPLFLKFRHSNPLFASLPNTPNSSSSSHYQSPQLQEAQEALSQILHLEFGISMEDSVSIASNCPKYLEMLVDGIRDLDDLSLWDSWTTQPLQTTDLDFDFKKKLLYMAKQKGDNGKVAFMESIGLTLSSAMNVARYLSLGSLPCLIQKVHSIKEMFFSGSDDEEGLIAKTARRMMTHLSIPIDDDIQQTLSFFEKIEARRGGLDMLGSKDASFRYLVEAFPRLLLLSVESRMKPIMDFLETMGVPRGRLRNVLLLFPPIIFCDIEKDIKTRVLAFEKVGAVDKDVGKILLKYPWILSTSIQENYELILSFFDMEKVPKVGVALAIRSWPYILGCSTSNLKLMVAQFSELGVRNKKIGKVIAKSPQLLLQKPQEFEKMVSFFEDLGFDRETVGKLLGRCPEIFATSIENTLKKKLEFLAGLGVSRDNLPRVIKKYPELLMCGIDRTLLPRVKYLNKIGLSKRDIAFMVRRFSPLLGYSIDEVLRPKVEFLVNTMEKPVREVVNYPRYFSYSLEKRIKPRFWVLKGRNVECNLKDMLGKNDEEFAAEFMGVGRILVPPSPPYHK